jgi:PTS system nitrogen regulatory IIA component
MTKDRDTEIMTLTEVADYLQLAERTVLRMAQRGEIPAAKVASQWRFLRPVVRDWLAAQMQTIPAAAGPTGGQRELLPIEEIVRPEWIHLQVQPGPKEAVLRQLVTPLETSGFARDPQRLLVSLVERERMMTTAIGHGVAVPHPRRPLQGMFSEPGLVVGLCRRGTCFDAVDDRLVHLFFLICATREEVHLQLMAKVAWLSRQELVRPLSEASSETEAISIIHEVARSLRAQQNPDSQEEPI